MDGRKPRVYCAGPLFNAKEREEMAELAAALEAEGFATFLPQRDGLELVKIVEALAKRGLDEEGARDLVARAIFALDVYQVVEGCDAIVVNLNGRVPDEGAVAEAALAWSAGRAMVAYKADARAVFGGEDNPLVTGLFGFRVCETYEDMVAETRRALARRGDSAGQDGPRHPHIRECLDLGRRIGHALAGDDALGQVVALLGGQAAPPECPAPAP